jgi:hypothetical protein
LRVSSALQGGFRERKKQKSLQYKLVDLFGKGLVCVKFLRWVLICEDEDANTKGEQRRSRAAVRLWRSLYNLGMRNCGVTNQMTSQL